MLEHHHNGANNCHSDKLADLSPQHQHLGKTPAEWPQKTTPFAIRLFPRSQTIKRLRVWVPVDGRTNSFFVTYRSHVQNVHFPNIIFEENLPLFSKPMMGNVDLEFLRTNALLAIFPRLLSTYSKAYVLLNFTCLWCLMVRGQINENRIRVFLDRRQSNPDFELHIKRIGLRPLRTKLWNLRKWILSPGLEFTARSAPKRHAGRIPC